ncbi:MAG: peptide deformylase [Betaproteobacteria bacterium]|jgi:peptide deformylase
MALLPILQYPDSRLHRVALPVTAVDEAISLLIKDMAETMYAAPGIGLAATQVDALWRIVVIDNSATHDQLRVFINPEIVARSGVSDFEEGCLSVPGIYEKVLRADRITVRALDAQGQHFELEADGLLAVCIQHEMDHLDGKVFVDYLSRLKQQRIAEKMKKQRRRGA